MNTKVSYMLKYHSQRPRLLDPSLEVIDEGAVGTAAAVVDAVILEYLVQSLLDHHVFEIDSFGSGAEKTVPHQAGDLVVVLCRQGVVYDV